MTANDFEMVGNPAEKILNTGFHVSSVTYTTMAGSGTVVSAVPVVNNLDAGVSVLSSAPGGTAARGTHRAKPFVNLDVPAETLIGDYASTVTGTLNSIP